MPTFLWPWGNLVIYPALLFILFVLVAGMWQNLKDDRRLKYFSSQT